MSLIGWYMVGEATSAISSSVIGLLGMTRALENEWSPLGMRVNAIAPGYMNTEFTAAHRQDPARYETMLARMPIGRWGTLDDLAGAVVYLASEASACITGTVLSVDGGWSAR